MDTTILYKLVQKKDLTVNESQQFLRDVVKGDATAAQIGSVLVALRAKGESTDEIVGFVETMRENMVKLNAPGAIDIVGTGGDGSGTFNISTASALVVAGAGVLVAKHGNRAASSKCGSADVLEALGVNIELTKEQAEEVFKNIGFVFMLAPLFHPAMKQVGAIRKELKIRTIFNLLGPFANPASTKRQLTGVPDKASAEKIAKAALRLGYERLLLVTSSDGMDEISLSAKTYLFEVRSGKIKRFVIDPKKLGFKAKKSDLLGGDSEENAAIIRAIFEGKKGPKRDAVVLNSAYALLAAEVVKTPKEGVKKAEESIDSGKAKKLLNDLVRETQKFKT